jgi:hypothetical protein
VPIYFFNSESTRVSTLSGKKYNKTDLLFSFYDRFCFVRFKGQAQTIAAQTLNPPIGVTTFESAKQYYTVPYPQPDDENRGACKILHVFLKFLWF